MFKKILPPRLLRSALFVLCLGSGAAQAAVTVSVGSPVSAGMATFTLNSGTATTGYLTVLSGGADCGTAGDIQAGKASGGTADAYRRGSLALTADTPASYTVRNLAHDAHYTVCATNGAEVARAIFSTPKMATYASPQWQTVGGAAVATGQAGEQSLSFAPDGKPYVAYPDGDWATVRQYNGSTWELVGSSRFSDGGAGYYSLSFAPDGTPYVAYMDAHNNSNKATVKYFDGVTWSDVGAARFSAGWAYYLSLAFAPDGTPYVAYQDRGNAHQVMVMRYDTAIVTPAWVSVGGGAASDGAKGYELSLSFAPDGTPYVAYSVNTSTTMVRRYVNGAWEDVGSSVGTAQFQSLSFAPDGTPYVAYVDGNQQSRITVKRLAGADWVIVGNALFSLEQSTGVSLAFAPDGVPYVAYSVRDGMDPTYKTQVMRLETATWVAVGGAEFSGGSLFSAPSMSFAPDGTPYVAYPDGAGDPFSDGPTIVKRLVGLPGAPTAVTAVAGNLQATVSFTVPESSGGSAITGYTVTATPPAPALAVLTTCTVSPCTVTGLTNGIAYTFTVTATNVVGGSVASDASDSVTPSLLSVSIGIPVPSASMVTLTLKSDVAGTGYLTVLKGSSAVCDPVQAVQNGQTYGDAPAYRRGSLALVANTDASYTVRNLEHSSDYTVCATNSAGSPVVSANFSTTAMATYANPGWQAVGGAGFSTGEAEYQSLAFTPDGTPYVAYRDDYQDADNNRKITVRRYDGTNWVPVGPVRFSDARANYQSLSFAPDGTPYVAYQDEAGNSYKTTVMRLNGTVWESVGAPRFSKATAFYQSLSFAPDGTPYVAYMDRNTNPVNKATVMRFNAEASPPDWEPVGNAGFSSNTASYLSLSFAPDGTPYVAYQDGANSARTTVMRYNATATTPAWENVGIPGFSSGTATYQSLSFAPDGTPYVAYQDGSKTTVMRYNATATTPAWESVGIPGFSSGAASYQSLSFAPDGTPYVAYKDGSKTTVMRYNAAATTPAWESVGIPGFSSGAASYQSLSFAPDGTPYVAYQDGSKATVKRLVNLSLMSVSPDSGSIAGGTPVTLTGANFNGTTTVSFGGTLATGITVVSATQITATTPSHAAGAVDIVVTTAGGTVTLASGYSYTDTLVAPIAGAVSATVAANSSANAIALNLSGGDASSVSVLSLASHGSATASGTSISYTPAAGYSGADSFSYTAANASGTSAAATVTITVTAPPSPPGPGPSPISGICGSVNAVSVLTAPSANLCSAGTASSMITTAAAFDWSCNGSSGGSDAQCSAPRQYAHAITAAAQPAIGGSATCNPGSAAQAGSATCSATAKAGYVFKAWTGACAGQSNVCSLSNITAAQSSVALFQATGLTLAEGPQEGEGLGLEVAASAVNWILQSASTATVASTGSTPPSGVELPHGLVHLTLDTGTAGTSASVVLTYPQPLPAGTKYYKFGKTAANRADHWYEFSGAVIEGNTITLTIQDGGEGDNDLTANSVIQDPGGPAVLKALPPPEPPPPSQPPPEQMVKLQLTTSGAGIVQRSVPGSVLSAKNATTATIEYPQNQALTLTAHPQSGASFAGWTGACTGYAACRLTLRSDQTVQATFRSAPEPENTCRSNNFSANEERVIGAYLAYYGRPADVDGMTYWAVYMAGEGGNIEAIIDAFGNSREFQQRFGQMKQSQLIANLYWQMYGHLPDPSGAAFYEAKLASGLYSLASIALNILDGTDGSDRAVLENRKKVARHFVTRMEELGRNAPTLDDGDVLARLLPGVRGDAQSTLAGCAQVDRLLDKPAGR